MKKLENYLNETILPKYNEADKGHDIRHINNVYSFAENVRSRCFENEVNKDMLKVAVYYHDLACKEDRENHHIKGSEYVLNDTNLRQWFTENQINIIADAVMNHRASSGNPTTTIAKILYDADRSEVFLERILERSYEYYIGKGFTDESVIKKNMYDHIKSKYGNGGYAKMILSESLAEIEPIIKRTKQIISNEDEFLDKIDKAISNYRR